MTRMHSETSEPAARKPLRTRFVGHQQRHRGLAWRTGVWVPAEPIRVIVVIGV